MTKLNVQNRTLAITDNLKCLRALNNECIDLIAIDPPFATNETFVKTPKTPISEEELQEEVDLAQPTGYHITRGWGRQGSATCGIGMTMYTQPGKPASRTTTPRYSLSYRQWKPALQKKTQPTSASWQRG